MKSPHRPRRRFGQNFLHDRDAIARIVDAVDAGDGARVVEIGPGRGALTEPLLARFDALTAIEVDRDLAAALGERFGERLELIVGDVLATKLEGPVALVGNLPYNVSKPIAMRLFDLRFELVSAVLMFQREVADKLCATPGTPAYGPLSVLLAHAFRIEPLLRLGPAAFRPRPKVDSTVTCWRPVEQPIDVERGEALRRLLRPAFAHRRKRMANNLAPMFGSPAAAAEALEQVGLSRDVRAERVTPAQFLALAERTR